MSSDSKAVHVGPSASSNRKVDFHENNRDVPLPQNPHTHEYATQEATIEPTHADSHALGGGGHIDQPSFSGDPAKHNVKPGVVKQSQASNNAAKRASGTDGND